MMKSNIMIGIGFLICLFIFIPTVHADSGQLYKVESETLELLDAPDQNATVLAELNEGAEVTIFEESSGFGKTFYNGKEAWAALDQLAAVNEIQTEQIDAEQPDEKEQQVQTTTSSERDMESGESVENEKLYRVEAPAVNLRNSPDKNATIITELNNGEEVTIFGESSGWGKTYYNDKEVWIALDLLAEKNESTDCMTSQVNEKAETQQTTEAKEKEESEEERDEKDNEKSNSTVENKEKEEKQDDQKQSSGRPLDGYHFVIDPGHGGKDTGTIGSEVDEKTLTRSIAKKVEKQLLDTGASVTLTRKDDTFIPLEERAKISNSNDTDAFISLHYNAFEEQSVRGINTFYYDGDANQKLANSIQKSLISHVELNDRGTQQADYQVLRDNKQLAVLIELGFLSNPEEQKLVQTDSYQKNAARGIVAGLEDYFK